MVGEICVSGPMVTAGYDRLYGATCDARFKIGNHENHRMGDLGYLDKDGNLRFLGRKAERVITPAGPIETERCEPSINELPSVNCCALIGLGIAPNQEPYLVIEPNKEMIRATGEASYEMKFLMSWKFLFQNLRSEGFCLRKKFLLMHATTPKFMLVLAKKWTKLVSRKPKLGIPS